MKSFLKWAGGKGKQLDTLLRGMPEPQVYHEPFLGGGALFFSPDRPVGRAGAAILSDACAPLVATYHAVRDDVDGVVASLWAMQATYREAEDPRAFYDEVRAELNTDMRVLLTVDDQVNILLAARFIFINRAGFNGLWRVNKGGRCNVPWGKDHGVRVLFEDELRAASAALRGASIELADFRDSLRQVQDGDVCYLDPPYVPLVPGRSFVGYGAGGFAERDQRDLAQLAAEAVARGAHVMASNSDTPLVRELYPEPRWWAEQVRAPRSVNSDGAGRGTVGELVMRSWA